jgi:hypothetical protein
MPTQNNKGNNAINISTTDTPSFDINEQFLNLHIIYRSYTKKVLLVSDFHVDLPLTNFPQ